MLARVTRFLLCLQAKLASENQHLWKHCSNQLLMVSTLLFLYQSITHSMHNLQLSSPTVILLGVVDTALR